MSRLAALVEPRWTLRKRGPAQRSKAILVAGLTGPSPGSGSSPLPEMRTES